MSEGEVSIGTMLAGKYRVEKVLGTGAMGIVVAAMHVDLQEMRAIKFMLPNMLANKDGVERFLREARAAVRLKSQHIAKIHDIGRLDSGAPYIVMEYLEGQDLKAVCEARGALPVPEAVRYLRQSCEAIGEAHGLGIIHRDLKPANMFITTGPSGAPLLKVLDFGIAKVAGADLHMTGTSELLGTPLYMSPEQMRSTRNVDVRSDIWSLGVILYRMLVGKPPFAGSTVTEICSAVLADEPEAPKDLRGEVPAGLDAIVIRCLQKSPAKRFQTAKELADALGPYEQEQPPAPPKTGGSGHKFNSTQLMDQQSPQAAAPPGRHAHLPAPTAPVATPPPNQAQGHAPQLAARASYGDVQANANANAAFQMAVAAAHPVAVAPPVAGARPANGTVPLTVAESSAISAATAPGNSTAGASTWTQSGGASPAPKRSWVGFAVVGIMVLGVGGVFAGTRLLGAKQAADPQPVAPAATAIATAIGHATTASAQTAAPSAPEPTVSPAATTAAPEPTAEPTPSATAAPSTAPVRPGAMQPRALPKPAYVEPYRPPPPPAPKRDAFGDDRR